MPTKRKAFSDEQASTRFTKPAPKRPRHGAKETPMVNQPAGSKRTAGPEKLKKMQMSEKAKWPETFDIPTTPKGHSKSETTASKRPGLVSMLSNQPASTQLFAKRPEKVVVKESVLVRPTARTKYLKGLAAQAARREAKEGKATMLGKDKEHVDDRVFVLSVPMAVKADAGFGLGESSKMLDAVMKGTVEPRKEAVGLTDLPKELRDSIWRLVVVEPKTFINPVEGFGIEQPDLAMVSRFIRNEVLPIFYAENIFEIDTDPAIFSPFRIEAPEAAFFNQKPLRGARKLPTAPPVFNTWAAMLEESGWYGLIRKWCLSYEDNTNLFAKCVDRWVHISLALQKRDNGKWSADVVVHREASCFFPAHQSHGKCVAASTPEWLNRAVMKLLEGARGGSVRGDMMATLAKAIRQNASTSRRPLLDFRCGGPVPKEEPMSAPEPETFDFNWSDFPDTPEDWANVLSM